PINAGGILVAVGFSIGNIGYITGSDFWQYDPSANTWTQKTDFVGGHRFLAVGFSISSRGYMGTGFDNLTRWRKNFWEYDPSTDTWAQKADFGGTARHSAVGFNIGNKGYIGTGVDVTGLKKDFW